MAPKKILIVEDEKSLRDALVDKLTMESFSCLEAQNGQEGYDLAVKEKPDLILLDIVMPVMDGITMANKLRESEHEDGDTSTKYIPIIFLTNLTAEDNKAKAQLVGSFNYLIKSDWKLEDLVKKIKDTLGM